MARVLVTGGAGFIGSVLVRRLLESCYEVRVLDRLLYGGHSLLPFMKDPRFKFTRGDIRRSDAVQEAVSDADYVVHLAAMVGEPVCSKYPEMAVEVNLTATIQLYNECLKHGTRGFIFASTCSNYGYRPGSQDWMTEGSTLNPTTLYARTKVQAEEHLLRSRGLPTIIMRLATAYGLSQRTRLDLLVNAFVRDAVSEGKVKVHGPSAWRPIAHVEDHASAVLLFLRELERMPRDGPPDVYNVGSNQQNFRKKDLGEMVCGSIDARLIIDNATVEDRSYRVDFSRMRGLGFVPALTPNDGIREVAEAIRSGLLGATHDELIHDNADARIVH